MTTFAFPASITTTGAVAGWDQGFTKDSTTSQGEVRYLRQNNTYRIGFMPNSTTGVVLFFVNNNSTSGDPTYWTKNGQTVSDNTQVVGGDVISLFSSTGSSNGTFTVQHSWLGTTGGGTGTEGVNTPYVIWGFPNRSCGETTFVSVTHTEATTSATTYTVHDETGQIGTIVVGTASDASANFGFTISSRTLQVKNADGSQVLSSRVFTCGPKKVFCNFW